MKSAQVALWNSNPSPNPKAPVLYGSVQLPAGLVHEIATLMSHGQGMEVNQQTGEQYFKLRVSMWRQEGANNGPILSGSIESPSERAAYLASKAQAGVTAPAGQPWGAPPPPPAAPQGYPQPPQGYPPAPQPAAPAPAYPPAAPAPAPNYPPAPQAPAPQTPAPGGWGGGWG